MEPVRSCMALQWTLTRKGEQIASGCAVNDVVLSRGPCRALFCLMSILPASAAHYAAME